MAESFYLVDKKKRQECNLIETKLKEEMFPDFFKKVTHELVDNNNIDPDIVENITGSIFKSVFSYSKNNFYDFYFDERLGFYTMSGYHPYFTFDNIYIDDFGMTINNMEVLKQFLENHPDFIIEDEDERSFSFDEFKKYVDNN